MEEVADEYVKGKQGGRQRQFVLGAGERKRMSRL
jgi:hypothetical protein